MLVVYFLLEAFLLPQFELDHFGCLNRLAINTHQAAQRTAHASGVQAPLHHSLEKLSLLQDSDGFVQLPEHLHPPQVPARGHAK